MKEKSKYKNVFNHIWTLLMVAVFIYFGIDHLTKEDPNQFDNVVGILELVFAFILSYSYIRKIAIYFYNFYKA